MATFVHRFSRINSLRSLNIQRRYIRGNLNIKNTMYQTYQNNNNIRKSTINYHSMRSFGGIPPIILYLLRSPLARPLLIMIGGFIGGIILQLWRGQPPQWYHIKSICFNIHYDQSILSITITIQVINCNIRITKYSK